MGTFDAFQRLVWSPQFKQNCFPHRSKMGVLKSFLNVAMSGGGVDWPWICILVAIVCVAWVIASSKR